MRLVDRHVGLRYLWNTAVVFALLFVFAISIDSVLQIDRFVEGADDAIARGEYSGRLVAVAVAIFDFHGPRIFQFFAYLLGLVTVAGMGFTLAQMHRHRELSALLASGMSLQRVALPLIAVTVGLNLLQVANTEFMLPRLAPLLVREHGDILAPGLSRYPVPLTRDAAGTLIQARLFDPATDTMVGVLAIEREAQGRGVRRIAAASATWDPARRGWSLVAGTALRPERTPSGGDQIREPVDFLPSELDPRSIAVRRSAIFAGMLSLAELRDVERAGQTDPVVIAKARWGRFAGILSNLVIFLLALPSYLLREQDALLERSLQCAAIVVPASLLVLIGATITLPGVSPALSVFIPVAALAPLAVSRFLAVRT